MTSSSQVVEFVLKGRCGALEPGEVGSSAFEIGYQVVGVAEIVEVAEVAELPHVGQPAGPAQTAIR